MTVYRRKYLKACLKHYSDALAVVKGLSLPGTPAYKIASEALATSPKDIMKKAKKGKKRVASTGK